MYKDNRPFTEDGYIAEMRAEARRFGVIADEDIIDRAALIGTVHRRNHADAADLLHDGALKFYTVYAPLSETEARLASQCIALAKRRRALIAHIPKGTSNAQINSDEITFVGDSEEFLLFLTAAARMIRNPLMHKEVAR